MQTPYKIVLIKEKSDETLYFKHSDVALHNMLSVSTALPIVLVAILLSFQRTRACAQLSIAVFALMSCESDVVHRFSNDVFCILNA